MQAAQEVAVVGTPLWGSGKWFLLAAALFASSITQVWPGQVCWLDRQRLERLGRDLGFRSSDVAAVSRNATGDRLFVSLRGTNSGSLVCTILPSPDISYPD
jgi:hypothetical protein